jgi:hypothetical protein
MGLEILVPLAPFIMVVGIVIAVNYFKSKNTEEINRTLRAAIEKGQTLSKEDFEMLRQGSQDRTPMRDIRSGVITLAVAAGIATMGYFIGNLESDAYYPIMGVASIPGFIGIALIIIGIVRSSMKK